MEEDSDGMSGPGLTPGVSKNGPQKWKRAQQVNHQVEREAGWPDGRTVQGVSTTPKVKIKMKKLMIALAAAGLVGGAYAGCQEDTKCVFAYQVSLSGKSTVAASTKAKPSACIDADCYRKAGSYKVKGYIWGTTTDMTDPSQCVEGCGCLDLSSADTYVEKVTYLWNTKTLKKLGDMEFSQLDLVGSNVGTKAKTVEVVAKIDDLVLAGFGKYNTKKLEFKSASGYFAGTVAAPVCMSCTYNQNDCTEDCEQVPSKAFTLCALGDSDVTTTPAYGKWSIKYSKSAAKKLTKKYDAATLVPAKVIAANANP